MKKGLAVFDGDMMPKSTLDYVVSPDKSNYRSVTRVIKTYKDYDAQ